MPFPDWHSTLIYDKNMPVQLQRRCAAIGDTVYCTPGYFAPITAFDAATGAVKKKYEGTKNTTEFVYDRGTLYVVTGEPTYDRGEGTDALGTSKFDENLYGPPVITFKNPKSTIAAIDAASGRTLWQKSGQDTAGYLGATLGIVGDRVVLYTGSGRDRLGSRHRQDAVEHPGAGLVPKHVHRNRDRRSCFPKRPRIWPTASSCAPSGSPTASRSGPCRPRSTTTRPRMCF